MRGVPLIAVFAEYPQPGAVKPRLQPHTTPAETAELHACCLRATWLLVKSLPDVAVVLAASPDDSAPDFTRLLAEAGRASRPPPTIWPQGAGDMGVRLSRIAARAFEEGRDRIVMIVADCPGLSRAILAATLDDLTRLPIVIGPTFSGGYYLLGLNRDAWTRGGLRLLTDLDCDHVAARTRQRAVEIGLEWSNLPTLRDVDRWEDLRNLAADWPPDAPDAEPLRACIAGLLARHAAQ